MQSIHPQAGLPINRRQPLVSIHWDYQNIPDTKIAKNILSFASLQGCVVTRKVYSNWEWETSKKAKRVLESIGFECIHVPLCIKNAVDFKLVIDCGCESSSYLSPDIVILIGGDEYGQILLNELQPKRKEVIVFARKESVDKNLQERADRFYYIDDLPNLVGGYIQSHMAAFQPHITYKDATEYLLEAIKTASSKGKRTKFSLIDNLMRQRFSNYQGASSISKPDGKTFSRFSKFVDAVVADGKVRMQNQELFLIEEHKLAT